MKNPELLIFDVNETLLDMTPLKESINKALENELAFDIWFPTLLQYSLVESITKEYQDFSKIAAATFKMIAQKFGFDFSDKEIEEILSPIKKLKPHPEVVEALSLLKKNNFKMIALTNGKPEVAKAQLQFAEIDGFFDEVLSVELVKRYKPHLKTYKYVLDKYAVSEEKVMMIAAHGWDIAGAQRARLQTAFISRSGKFEYPLADKPTVIGPDLLSIAKSLLSA